MKVRLLLSATICLLGVTIVMAEEFTATLDKVEGNKVTFSRGTGKKKQTKTLMADENCRVVVAKYDAKSKRIEAGDAIADGLKNARFEKLNEEPIGAWIRTDAANEKILELRVYQIEPKKKKK